MKKSGPAKVVIVGDGVGAVDGLRGELLVIRDRHRRGRGATTPATIIPR